MGADFAKAALPAGHSVVASGRDTDRVSKALGQSNDLLPVKLDVTSRADAEVAVRAASIGSAAPSEAMAPRQGFDAILNEPSNAEGVRWRV
jgi:NAD(P)-dependent dehydrogenase (short-subunit alcohol dehydrogenase family)